MAATTTMAVKLHRDETLPYDAYTTAEVDLLGRRRGYAASLIPTTTGAARALGTVLPELDGRIGALAIRAPIPVGSIVDLVVELSRPVDGDEVNAAFRVAAAEGSLSGSSAMQKSR